MKVNFSALKVNKIFSTKLYGFLFINHVSAHGLGKPERQVKPERQRDRKDL